MKAITLSILILAVAACSTQRTQEKIEQKIGQETGVSDGKTLETSIHEFVRKSTTLSDAQKEDLERVLGRTKEKNRALLEQSFKLKSILIKELVSGDVDMAEVRLLKKDIKLVEADRTKNGLAAMDEILRIVGEDPELEIYSNYLLMEHNVH